MVRSVMLFTSLLLTLYVYCTMAKHLCQRILQKNTLPSVDLVNKAWYSIISKLEVVKIKNRIKEIRQMVGLTQSQLAERLNLTRNYIGLIETGDRVPSDRTISDICREFGVREEWLRTGEEPMFVEIPESEKIAAFLGDLMREEDGSFKKQLIEILSEMSPDEWELMERMARKLTGR